MSWDFVRSHNFIHIPITKARLTESLWHTHYTASIQMWSTTLSLTLLLTAASLISGAALPPIPLSPPSRVPGLSLSCPRIPSKPAVLGPQRIRSPTTSVTAPRSLSARVIPYCIEGALAGGMISADFILLSGQAWTLYWEPERLVLGGEWRSRPAPAPRAREKRVSYFPAWPR